MKFIGGICVSVSIMASFIAGMICAGYAIVNSTEVYGSAYESLATKERKTEMEKRRLEREASNK